MYMLTLNKILSTQLYIYVLCNTKLQVSVLIGKYLSTGNLITSEKINTVHTSRGISYNAFLILLMINLLVASLIGYMCSV
jgi:hypothetical protein